MKIAEMISQRDALKAEARAILDKAGTEKRSLSADESKLVAEKQTKLAELVNMVDAEAKQIELESRAASVPATRTAESGSRWAELVEKRALALSTNGDSAFANQFFVDAAKKATILSKVTIEYGAVPNQMFPLISGMDHIGDQTTEDGTGGTVSGAAFAPVMVSPAPHMGWVLLTDYILKQFPAIEAKVRNTVPGYIASGMNKLVIDALFSAKPGNPLTETEAAASGAPTIADARTAISKMVGRYGRSQLTLVANPTFVNAWRSADTYGNLIQYDPVAQGYRIDGVIVVEDDNAPVSTTAGDPTIVVGDFSAFGIAVANPLEFELLSKIAGSLNVPLQFVLYYAGAIVLPSAFQRIKSKSAQ